MGKAPAFQFYPGDWTRDLDDQDLEIEGAWIRICCRLWWSDTKGTATKTLKEWSNILRTHPKKTGVILKTLLTKKICDGVYLDNQSITIISRRMVKDHAISELRRKVGSLGGNPKLKKQGDVLDNQTSNQTGNQKPTPSSSSSSLEPKILNRSIPSTNTPTDVVIGVSAEAETSHQKEKVYRRSQMPKDFQLTPGRKAYAEAKGLNGRIPEVWEAFCLHHQSKGSVMVDWDKAWMKWVLNDVRFNPPGKSDAGYPRGEQPADEERLEARMSEIAKRKGLLP